MSLRLSILVLLPALLGAGHQATTQEVVEVHAEILAYELAAVHDLFEDGSTRLYDATVMKVLSPAEYVEKGDLRFLHDEPPAAASRWRQAGRSFRFEINREDLNSSFDETESTLLFSGAVRNGLLPTQAGQLDDIESLLGRESRKLWHYSSRMSSSRCLCQGL